MQVGDLTQCPVHGFTTVMTIWDDFTFTPACCENVVQLPARPGNAENKGATP